MPDAWNEEFPDDVMLNTAVLTHEVAAVQVVVGITRGGNNFKKNATYRNPEFDGKRHRIAGMTRPIGWDSEFSGTFLQLPSGIIAKFEPGSTSVTAGTPAVTTITPPSADGNIALGSLLVKPTLTFRRGSGGTFAVQFYYGFVETWDINARDKDEGEVPYVIKAEVDPAMVGYNSNLPPFKYIETAAA